jgi:hypothetical protein
MVGLFGVAIQLRTQSSNLGSDFTEFMGGNTVGLHGFFSPGLAV